MADVFDQVAAPTPAPANGDVFDQIAPAKPKDIFDQVAPAPAPVAAPSVGAILDQTMAQRRQDFQKEFGLVPGVFQLRSGGRYYRTDADVSDEQAQVQAEKINQAAELARKANQPIPLQFIRGVGTGYKEHIGTLASGILNMVGDRGAAQVGVEDKAQDAQDNQGVVGKVGSAVGGVIPMVGTGITGAVLQSAVSGYENEMEKSGSQGKAVGAALKAAPEMAAYWLIGLGAAKAVAPAIEAASPAVKAAVGAVASTVANMVSSGVIRKAEGGSLKPDVQSVTQDSIFGLFHGVKMGLESSRKPTTTTEGEPNATQEGQQQENNQQQHPPGDEGGKAPASGSSDSPAQGGEVAQEKEVVLPPATAGVSMGPGAAKAGEVPSEGEGTVGARHESINARADAMGFPSIERGKVDNPADMVVVGNAVYESMPEADRARHLERLSHEDPQKITDAEFSFLRAHQRELYRQANEAWQAARGSNDPTLAKAAVDAEQRRQAFDEKVIKPYGTAFAQKGRSLQGEVDIDSGNFIQTKQRFEDTQKRPPTPEETKKLENLTDTVKAGEAEVEKQKESVVKAGDESFGKSNEIKDPIDKVSSSLDKIAYDILKANPTFSETELSAALAADPRVKEAFPDLTPDQIEEIASRYGQSRPVSGDPVRLKLIDLKRQWQEQAKQRDMAAGSAPRKTGTVQAEPSAELRAEMKRTNEAKRRGGFKITDPEKQLRGALEAAKTRSNNSIADLQREIDAKQRAVKSKTTSPTDPELEALKQKLAETRARHQQVFGEIDTQALRDKFSGKTDSKFTPEESKQIWEQARNRITNLKSGQDFDVAIRGLSEDLGLTPEQVMHALASKPKLARLLGNNEDSIWFKQSRTRKLRNAVDEYVRTAGDPRFKKVVKGIPNALSGSKIGFGLHNLSIPITHAYSMALMPTKWASYFRYYGENVKSSFGKSGEAFTEKTRQMITSNPNYARQLRSGLAVSADKITDSEQAYVQALGKKVLGVNPDSAFVMLKDLRQKIWDQEYSKLSETAKSDPDMLKEVSSMVNTLTNGDTGRFGNSPLARKFVFSPQKTAAEIKGTIVRPAKALGTAVQIGLSKAGLWTEPTAAQRYAAKMTVRNSAEIVGTYVGLLAVNAGLNKFLGSKDKINFTDHTKTDWMKFKVGGQVFTPASGSVSAIRMMANIASALVPGQKEKGQQNVSRLTGYGEGKLGPVYQPVLELGITKHTYGGDVVPYLFAPNEKPSRGHRQLSMLEYAGQKIVLIPAEEAWQGMSEVMQRQGLSLKDIRVLRQGLISGGAGMLGFSSQPDEETGQGKAGSRNFKR